MENNEMTTNITNANEIDTSYFCGPVYAKFGPWNPSGRERILISSGRYESPRSLKYWTVELTYQGRTIKTSYSMAEELKYDPTAADVINQVYSTYFSMLINPHSDSDSFVPPPVRDIVAIDKLKSTPILINVLYIYNIKIEQAEKIKYLLGEKLLHRINCMDDRAIYIYDNVVSIQEDQIKEETPEPEIVSIQEDQIKEETPEPEMDISNKMDMQKIMKLTITDTSGCKLRFLDAISLMDCQIYIYLDHVNTRAVWKIYSNIRQKPFTLQEFYDAHQKIWSIVYHTKTKNATYNERTKKELEELNVINDEGLEINWSRALDLMDNEICDLISILKFPISEQEFFNKHNKIYKIANECEFSLNRPISDQ